MVGPAFSDGGEPERAPPGEDRRGGGRRRCTVLHTARLLARPKLQAVSAWVHDIGSQGLGLILPHPLGVGAVVAIHLRGVRTSMRSYIRSARVTHCRPW